MEAIGGFEAGIAFDAAELIGSGFEAEVRAVPGILVFRAVACFHKFSIWRLADLPNRAKGSLPEGAGGFKWFRGLETADGHIYSIEHETTEKTEARRRGRNGVSLLQERSPTSDQDLGSVGLNL